MDIYIYKLRRKSKIKNKNILFKKMVPPKLSNGDFVEKRTQMKKNKNSLGYD